MFMPISAKMMEEYSTWARELRLWELASVIYQGQRAEQLEMEVRELKQKYTEAQRTIAGQAYAILEKDGMIELLQAKLDEHARKAPHLRRQYRATVRGRR